MASCSRSVVTVGVPTRKGKTYTSYKEHLGNDIYVTVGVFKDDKLVNIRKFLDNDRGESKAQKIGIAMHPGRFASLVSKLSYIDQAYAYVQAREGEWRTIHVGGELYASVGHGFHVVNLCLFYKVCTR